MSGEPQDAEAEVPSAGEGADDAPDSGHGGGTPPAAAVPDIDCGSFAEYAGLVDVVQAYRDASGQAGRKPNPLVVRSLSESVEAAKDSFFIEAPGNHKLTFTSRISDADCVVLGQVLVAPAPFLSRIDLSFNHITDVGAIALADTALRADLTQRLTSVSLRCNAIEADGCFAVCQSLVHCQTLRRLDLSGNPLRREGGELVVDLLRHSPGLLELYLQDTDADIDVLVATAEALLDPGLGLRVCNLENARITTLQEDHTVHIGRMLRVNTHLSEVSLGKLKIRDEGVRQLVSFLLENKTLRALDLRCNEIGADGAGHLGTYLSSDCQLCSLNLSSNRIGERANVAGARALAGALAENCVLRSLDLNGNGLCGDALKAIADAVDQNSMLESVALFHNDWDQPSSYKFHQILNDRARLLPLAADFVTRDVDLRIDVCKNWEAAQGG